MTKTNMTAGSIERERDRLLVELEKRSRIVRDLVRGVVRGYGEGLYLHGPAGTAKTHTVRGVLESELKVGYVYRRGHLTPLGLFELLRDNREEVIVLDDVSSLFHQPVALQVLLAALERPRPGRERLITYKRQGEESGFAFRGKVIAISNLKLSDAGMLQALRSRCHTILYDPPPDQLAALMLSVAAGGWPPGGEAVTPGEATEVARHLIGEALRLQARMDLRVFFDKALPLFMQAKDGEAESHWKDLVTASIEEDLSGPAHEAEAPATRAARIDRERRLAREIYDACPSPAERAKSWRERSGGKSIRAFYRRLEEGSDGGAEVSNLSTVTNLVPGCPQESLMIAHTFTPVITHDLGGHEFLQGRLPDGLLWDEAAFAAAWALHPEERPSIHLHGRRVQVPRWQQAFGRDYRFSGRTSEALPVPELLAPLLAWARAKVDPRLNGLLLNWYDGPGHHIGPHHDSVKGLVAGSPIVTISFGETRVFRLTPGKNGSGGRRDFPAPAGTVFIVPYDTNLVWKHQVFKSARYTGRRISVTVRAFEN